MLVGLWIPPAITGPQEFGEIIMCARLKSDAPRGEASRAHADPITRLSRLLLEAQAEPQVRDFCLTERKQI